MSLSDQYDGSFKSTGFYELFDGAFGAPESRAAVATSVHYPGGNTNAIKSGGKGSRQIEVPIACEEADWSSLKGHLDSSGSLVCSAYSGTAYLKAYRGQKLQAHAIVKGVLTFEVT